MINPKIRRWMGLGLLLVGVMVAVLGARAYWLLAWAGEVETVRFESADGVRLAGRLILPAAEDTPHPALVMLHGSGPETHGLPTYRLHANAFVRGGFAVLAYDKRGAGDSAGDFETSTYDDFVADATAAVRYLRTRSEIDGQRIGLLAFSEGGWLAPEVAERSEGIAFVVSRCGPPLSWIDTVAWEVENDRRADGFEGDDLEQVVDLSRKLWDYYVDTAEQGPDATATRRAEIESRIEALRTHAAFEQSGIRLVEYHADLYERWARDIAYDPTPFLRRTRVPMLYVFGEVDINVPTALAVRRLEQLRSEGVTGISYHVYEGVGHSLGRRSQFWNGGFPDDYFELLVHWAQEQTGAR